MSRRGIPGAPRTDLDDDAHRVRLDLWLWAARFFKTRSLAAEAIDGGKVEVGGEQIGRASCRERVSLVV